MAKNRLGKMINRETVRPAAIGSIVLLGGLALWSLTGGDHFEKAGAAKQTQQAAEAKLGYDVLSTTPMEVFGDAKPTTDTAQPNYFEVAKEALKTRAKEDAIGWGSVILGVAGSLSWAEAGKTGMQYFRFAGRPHPEEAFARRREEAIDEFGEPSLDPDAGPDDTPLYDRELDDIFADPDLGPDYGGPDAHRVPHDDDL